MVGRCGVHDDALQVMALFGLEDDRPFGGDAGLEPTLTATCGASEPALRVAAGDDGNRVGIEMIGVLMSHDDQVGRPLPPRSGPARAA